MFLIGADDFQRVQRQHQKRNTVAPEQCLCMEMHEVGEPHASRTTRQCLDHTLVYVFVIFSGLDSFCVV